MDPCQLCCKKVQHATKSKAKKALKSLQQQGMSVELYLCRCGGWRVGHPTASLKRAEREQGKTILLKIMNKKIIPGKTSGRRRRAIEALRLEELSTGAHG